MDFEYLLVGGGLQNGLIALCLRALRPDVSIGLVERGARLGGNHTWCFHEADIEPEVMRVVEPMVARRWAGYRVAFPRVNRQMARTYCAVLSGAFHDRVAEALEAPGSALLVDAEVSSVSANGVQLKDGRRLSAAVVVDSRGPAMALGEPIGYQKFLGLELALGEPTDDEFPMLMDATVPQCDGFRFFYRLAFSPRRILVEDTYYADGPELDVEHLRNEVLAYARHTGLSVASVEREESGVLPLFSRSSFVSSKAGPLAAGYQGGFFHPTTGYSFPVASRLARHIARTSPRDLFGREWQTFVSELLRQARFCHLLNRMLFTAFAPGDRRNVLERFYRLPESVIGNFYALRLQTSDRLRILCGRPPHGFSVRNALWPARHGRRRLET